MPVKDNKVTREASTPGILLSIKSEVSRLTNLPLNRNNPKLLISKSLYSRLKPYVN